MSAPETETTAAPAPPSEAPLDPSRAAIGAWSGGAFMPFGQRLERERLTALLRPDDAIRTVITADVYGEGAADRFVGEALSGLPRRSYSLVGAIGHDFYEGPREGRRGYQRFTDPRLRSEDGFADYLRMAAERSLERLGVDSFDLLLLHNPDRVGYSSEAVWAGMVALRDEGLTRRLGVAPGPDNGFALDVVYCLERFGELIDWAMLILNPFEPWPAELALPAAAGHGVRVITRVVDHGGVFWDDVRPGHRFARGDHRTFRPQGWVERANEKLERLRPIADEHDLTTMQLACCWNLANDAVECVVPTLLQEAGEDARPIEDKRAELAALPAEQPFGPEAVAAIREIGDNTGTMPLKGASAQYAGEPRADQWPLTPEVEDAGRRWGIEPDRDLYCPTDLRDLRERGTAREGTVQALDRRLFVQLQAFTGVGDAAELTGALERTGLEGIVYSDVNDPRGVAVLLLDEDPEAIVGAGLELFGGGPFAALEPKRELAMLGRSYGTGREPDLEDWLLHAPRRKLAGPNARWAIWYPLRRSGEYYRLPESEQGRILGEHGRIGRTFGEAGYADDVRLECFGLDRADNEFVIGLVGPRLDWLSRLIRAMRPTEQTARYMDSLGPFFVGRRVGHTIRAES